MIKKNNLKIKTDDTCFKCSDICTFLVYVPFYAPLRADKQEQNYFSLNWFCFSEKRLSKTFDSFHARCRSFLPDQRRSIIMKSVFPLTMLAIMAVMIRSVTSRDMSSHRSYRGELLFWVFFFAQCPCR